MSTFSGLNAATTALWAQRRALDVTGQNVAHVNTEGYSRQRADLRSLGGSVVPAFHSVTRDINGGVNADQVLRIRDAFLEARGQAKHSSGARLTAEADALLEVEQAFREPGNTGVQDMLAKVWAAWGDIENAPQSEATRTALLERSKTLAGGLHATDASMTNQWNQTRDNVGSLVAEVNAAAASIAGLNQAIKSGSLAGLQTNELADRRDLLILGRAEKIGATARPAADGVVDVYVGGSSLVSGNTATVVVLAGSTTPGGAGPNPPRIETSATGVLLRVSGTIGGELTALGQTIPSYLTQLDAIAANLANLVNTNHVTGYDLDGNIGGAMFDTGGPPGPITAANITVAITDPRKVAASALAPVPPAPPSLDGSHADLMHQLRLGPTGPDATYRKLIVGLGVQSSVAERNLAIQDVIVGQVDAARDSVTGVNLDEEMTNMLQFQHAYSAAGRLVTAIDETLDILINRTGIVGR